MPNIVNENAKVYLDQVANQIRWRRARTPETFPFLEKEFWKVE